MFGTRQFCSFRRMPFRYTQPPKSHDPSTGLVINNRPSCQLFLCAMEISILHTRWNGKSSAFYFRLSGHCYLFSNDNYLFQMTESSKTSLSRLVILLHDNGTWRLARGTQCSSIPVGAQHMHERQGVLRLSAGDSRQVSSPNVLCSRVTSSEKTSYVVAKYRTLFIPFFLRVHILSYHDVSQSLTFSKFLLVTSSTRPLLHANAGHSDK